MFVMKSSCFITNITQIFLFYVENALKMLKMRTLKNYADPHHCIPTDALKYVDRNVKFGDFDLYEISAHQICIIVFTENCVSPWPSVNISQFSILSM